MILARRASREVYRLYGEDEFFAYVERSLHGAVTEELSTPAGSAGEPRALRRVAGATLLVAAIGAVGGLVVITGPASIPGTGRKAGERMLASAGSSSGPHSPRARLWPGPRPDGGDRRSSGERDPASVPRSRARARTERSRASELSDSVEQHPRAVAAPARAAAPGRPRASANVAPSAPDAAQDTAPAPGQPPPSAPAAAAPAAAVQPRAQAAAQVEFGFEQ
ncbi:MAG TPA: hypothetical protein VMF09_10050 [Solirubrobacteraceae bacterium]|nr:hypothetical protein [Solirubrobacteraceae bacterium]